MVQDPSPAPNYIGAVFLLPATYWIGLGRPPPAPNWLPSFETWFCRPPPAPNWNLPIPPSPTIHNHTLLPTMQFFKQRKRIGVSILVWNWKNCLGLWLTLLYGNYLKAVGLLIGFYYTIMFLGSTTLVLWNWLLPNDPTTFEHLESCALTVDSFGFSGCYLLLVLFDYIRHSCSSFRSNSLLVWILSIIETWGVTGIHDKGTQSNARE